MCDKCIRIYVTTVYHAIAYAKNFTYTIMLLRLYFQLCVREIRERTFSAKIPNFISNNDYIINVTTRSHALIYE